MSEREPDEPSPWHRLFMAEFRRRSEGFVNWRLAENEARLAACPPGSAWPPESHLHAEDECC